jgi:benzoyl-CoA reductase/2-hydroxyglutaryl-CoA dehydratase subunit BcrC/BadD/HgdB
MMYDYFSSIVSGITAKLEEDPHGIHARKRYALAVAELGQRLYSENARIAWCGVTAPFDLLNSMGVTSCFVEFVGAMLASTETAELFMQEAEDAGYAADSCAYHRAVTGAMLKSAMPVPDFIIGTSSPCTAGLAVMENMAKQYGKDLFVLNVPQSESPSAVRFLALQIEEMAGFVADHTGQALSRNRLGEALELTNEATVLIKEIYGLAKQKPSPVDSRFLNNFGVVMALFMGTREGVDICRAFRDELSHRIATNAMDPSQERIRLMWVQNRIQFPFPMEAMLADYGAKIVVDELNDVTWEPMDPDNPFESIARRILSIPFSRNADSRVAHLQKLAREYQIDGAINPCHWGCRQGTGVRGIISNGLKEIGVPVLNLEIDCVDSRNLAKGQIQTRFEAFTEMIQG